MRLFRPFRGPVGTRDWRFGSRDSTYPGINIPNYFTLLWLLLLYVEMLLHSMNTLHWHTCWHLVDMLARKMLWLQFFALLGVRHKVAATNYFPVMGQILLEEHNILYVTQCLVCLLTGCVMCIIMQKEWASLLLCWGDLVIEVLLKKNLFKTKTLPSGFTVKTMILTPRSWDQDLTMGYKVKNQDCAPGFTDQDHMFTFNNLRRNSKQQIKISRIRGRKHWQKPTLVIM